MKERDSRSKEMGWIGRHASSRFPAAGEVFLCPFSFIISRRRLPEKWSARSKMSGRAAHEK